MYKVRQMSPETHTTTYMHACIQTKMHTDMHMHAHAPLPLRVASRPACCGAFHTQLGRHAKRSAPDDVDAMRAFSLMWTLRFASK